SGGRIRLSRRLRQRAPGDPRRESGGNDMRPAFAYVGSFTTQRRKARGQGISVYRIDPGSGAWRFVQALDAIPNPHFLALDRTQAFLYSAHGDSSQAGACARDPASGTLRFLGSQETGGDNSSTVTTDPGDRFVVLANGPGV